VIATSGPKSREETPKEGICSDKRRTRHICLQVAKDSSGNQWFGWESVNCPKGAADLPQTRGAFESP
jgi:hypothetical protein